ncbi:MAG: hypothetical protein HKP27_11440, partial [Myxococcales bacterium]|nr:hypothetical protein [Myxococcales bacterium]
MRATMLVMLALTLLLGLALGWFSKGAGPVASHASNGAPDAVVATRGPAGATREEAAMIPVEPAAAATAPAASELAAQAALEAAELAAETRATGAQVGEGSPEDSSEVAEESGEGTAEVAASAGEGTAEVEDQL